MIKLKFENSEKEQEYLDQLRMDITQTGENIQIEVK